MLRPAGRLIIIYTAERTTDILSLMRSERIEPKLIRMIHSDWKSEAKLIMIEGTRDGRPGLKVMPSLIVYDEKGEYTDEVQQMFVP